MQHTAEAAFSGDTGRAFDLAVSALTGIGFRLTERTAHAVELTGPGMTNSRQSPLAGASRIRVSTGGGQLALDADLGGVRRMARFVTIFPIALCLFLGVVFAVVFGVVLNRDGWIIPVVAVVGGNALLWLFLGPVVARGLRVRTCRALDTLLANMATAGQATGR